MFRDMMAQLNRVEVAIYTALLCNGVQAAQLILMAEAHTWKPTAV
jgi:hypothetical protein